MTERQETGWKSKLVEKLQRIFCWSEKHIPWGLRSVAGLLLIAGGIFGFLPVLGFWMIPMGAVLLALDIPPLKRRVRSRLDAMAAQRR